jgi:hypothetical protein
VSNQNIVMPIDRCSFEVIYKKTAQGDEVIDSVIVRTGISDAAVTLTIRQVYNLARLLDLVPAEVEQPESDHPANSLATDNSRAPVVRSDSDEPSRDAVSFAARSSGS